MSAKSQPGVSEIATLLKGNVGRPAPLRLGAPTVDRIAVRLATWPEVVADWRVSYGKSANLVLGDDGSMSCAEVEVVRRLRANGREAVWIDNFGSAPSPWRWASGNDRILPAAVQRRHSAIKQVVRETTGKPGGCWDVVTWDGQHLTYIECKGPGDSVKSGQVAWRVAGEELDPSIGWILLEWTAS